MISCIWGMKVESADSRGLRTEVLFSLPTETLSPQTPIHRGTCFPKLASHTLYFVFPWLLTPILFCLCNYSVCFQCWPSKQSLKSKMLRYIKKCMSCRTEINVIRARIKLTSHWHLCCGGEKYSSFWFLVKTLNVCFSEEKTVLSVLFKNLSDDIQHHRLLRCHF